MYRTINATVMGVEKMLASFSAKEHQRVIKQILSSLLIFKPSWKKKNSSVGG
jgi:hypothetical protein